MSSRRSGGAPKLTSGDDVNDLIMKLQALLSQLNQNNPISVVAASSVMMEACSCIQRLHKEIDDLSETLSFQLLDNKSQSVELGFCSWKDSSQSTRSP